MEKGRFGKVVLWVLVAVFCAGLVGAQDAGLSAQKDRIAKVLQKKNVPVAIIQPVGNVKPIETVSKNLGVNLVILTPEQMGDPNVFNPKNYPVILYTGSEQCAMKYQGKDLSSSLSKYMSEGGIFISMGACWPFYYASNWDDNAKKWVNDKPVQFNKEIGLFIQGKFEKPPEGVSLYFAHNPTDKIFSSLPKEFPYLQKGDLRLRATSAEAQEEEGGKYTPILSVKSKDGEEYGEAIALIQRPIEFKKTQIIYVWGSLLGTEYAQGIIADVFVYVLEQAVK